MRAREEDRTGTTTGRRKEDGGVGAGVEWSVFIGDCWTAGFDFEFTPNGPRLIALLTYYPRDGSAHSYGWSLLAGEVVRRSRWYLSDDDLRGACFWIPLAIRMQLALFLEPFR